MKKRIAIFCDGTRNTRKDETNVHRLYEKVKAAGAGADGLPQETWYDQGVGTRMTDLFTGAAFGRGVSVNVREAYETLREMWRKGDEIFLFGFSRGAFTVRSLAGFVAQYGMLRRGAKLRTKDLYKAYRTADDARPIYRIRKLQEQGETVSDFEKRVLEDCEIVRIRFIGVWDTVGTIGLPIGHFRRISSSENRFHTMEPRAIFQQCCHALAVDELRPHYSPILWKRFILENHLTPEGEPPQDDEFTSRYEQRWFVGAHSNVGGGYKNPSPVYKVPLKWMEDRAAAAGLGVADREQLDGTEHLEAINDSFAEFWPYKVAFWTKRRLRPIRRPGEKKVSKRGVRGAVFTLSETVDPTVLDRIERGDRRGRPYRPDNLSTHWDRQP